MGTYQAGLLHTPLSRPLVRLRTQRGRPHREPNQTTHKQQAKHQSHGPEGTPMRVCSSAGCPQLVSKAGRCPSCRRDHEQARGTRQQRGYDAAYDNERRHYQRRMDKGEAFTCWRCQLPITPDAWTLGHCDNHRELIHGPEHPACNYATSGRIDCPHLSHM